MPSKKKPSRKAKPAVQPSPKKPSPKKRTTKITVTKIGANGKRRVKIVSPSSAAAAAREEGLANEAEVRPSPVPAAVIEVAGSQSPPEDPFSEADKEPIYPPSSPVADRSEWEVVHEPLKAYIKPFCARYEERTRGTKRLFDEVDEAGGSSQQAARAVKPVGDSGYQEARDVQLRDLPFRPSSPLAAAGPSSPISSPSPSPRPSSVLLWEPEPSSQCEPLRLSQLHGDTLSDPQQLSSSSASSERESSGDISEAIELLDRSSTASADSRTDDLKLSSEDFEEEE
jgi:hypothetical protein